MGNTAAVNAYRLLDTSCAILETTVRLQDEMVKLRHDQIKSRKRSLTERGMIVLAAIVAGIPFMHQAFPAEWAVYRSAAIAIFAISLLGYLAVGINQIFSDEDADKELRDLLRENRLARVDIGDDPVFLQMQISTFLTRKSLAQEILSSTEDEKIKEKYELIVADWDRRVGKAKLKVEELHKKGLVSQNRYAQINDWMDSA